MWVFSGYLPKNSITLFILLKILISIVLISDSKQFSYLLGGYLMAGMVLGVVEKAMNNKVCSHGVLILHSFSMAVRGTLFSIWGKVGGNGG